MKDDDNWYIDDDGISYPNGIRGMFMSKELSFCGCISGEIEDDFINVLREFLNNEHIYYTQIAKNLNLDEKYIELILQYLDDKGFLDHGGSLRGSWLSDEGVVKLTTKYKEVFIK